MKVGVLFSGGKDSCLALHKYLKAGGKVDCLLSIMPKNKDSFMFHSPFLNLLKKQAEMLNLPLVIQETLGEEDKELNDLQKLIKKSRVDKIIIGGIKSNYQGKRIKEVCNKLGVEVEAPLWNYNANMLWDELLNEKFKIVIVKIASEGLSREFIGRIVDNRLLNKIKKLAGKYGFRLDFEGGDAETSVLWMPGFKKEIKIDFTIESEDKYRHFIKIKEIK